MSRARVNSHIPVRVEITHRFPDDFGALHMRLAGPHAELAHSIKNTPLGRLQSIPYVGQSPGYDDRHRIVQKGL